MIAARQRAGPVAGLAFSLVFGGLLVLTATADLFMEGRLPPDKPLPFTVRIPSIGLYRDTITGGATYHFQRVRQARGSRPSPEEMRLLQAYEDQRRPPTTPLLVGLALAFFLVVFLYTTHLRVLSPLTALFRTQIVLLVGLLLLAVAAKAYLAATAWSAMWMPLAALIIPVGIHLGARAAGTTTVAGAMILSLLVPIDLPLLVVLLCQGLAAGISAGKKGQRLPVLRGALAATVAGAFAFVASSLLLQQFVPGLAILQYPDRWSEWLGSDLIGSLGGGVASGLLAAITVPIGSRLLGVVPRTTLLALANFDNPLLKQIATRAPGTWAHSLAMANQAEMVANAIGADAMLVRIGAYYHDIGKTVQPEYYIENQEGGPNPHDDLDPDVSADAIFSHVTEGVKLVRKHKLPKRIVEFVYTHHGNMLLEYFWHKNMKAGNPKGLSEQDFRYPGCPPQSPETAILCICDAVEAASRTITEPDVDKIRQLVRQIVFTKLEQQMLDDAGLSIADLRKVVESLVETVRSFHHVRVKYPWQEKAEDRPPTGPFVAGQRAHLLPAAALAARPIIEEVVGGGPGASEVIPLVPSRARSSTGQRAPASSEHGDPTAERNRVTTMPLGVKPNDAPKSKS
jgi:cyclic-di-AMP phosphodiesterase PgpH